MIFNKNAIVLSLEGKKKCKIRPLKRYKLNNQSLSEKNSKLGKLILVFSNITVRNKFRYKLRAKKIDGVAALFIYCTKLNLNSYNELFILL